MSIPKVPPQAAPIEDPHENRKENIIAISIVLVVVVLFGWWFYSAVQAYRTPVVSDRTPIPQGDSPTLGVDSAPISVVVFSDFECPFCGEFARNSFPAIKTQFIDTGVVKLSFRHFPLTQVHGHALLSAEAAACANEQGQFWEYHDVLYAHQDALEIGNLQSYAANLGLDLDRFRQCLVNEELLPAITQDKNLGIRAGVTGTPTFFFNGRRVAQELTPEEFAEEVAKEQATP